MTLRSPTTASPRLSTLGAALLITLFGCGDDRADPNGVESDTGSSDVTGDADTTLPDTAPDTATDTTASDSTAPDGVEPDLTSDTDPPNPCADVTCAPAPCKVNGRCTAASAPSCVYDDAPRDTACDLLGVGDGVCEAGACRLPPQPCRTNGECAAPGTSCVQGLCAVRGRAGASCEETEDCVSGWVCDGGRCLGDLDVPCDADGDCQGICHEGFCSRDSRFGGPCQSINPSLGCIPGLVCGPALTCVYGPGDACLEDRECGGNSTCDPTKKTCVVADGAACDGDDQCRDICLVSFCGQPSSFGSACGEDADCLDRLACDLPRGERFGQCRQANGQLCFDDSFCVSDSRCRQGPGDDTTCQPKAAVGAACGPSDPCVSAARCVNAVCVALAPLGGACVSTSDCAAGVCAAGTCGLNDGAACTGNDQCVNTCVGNRCAPTCLTCACDDADDCGPSLSCDLDGGQGALTCKYPLGSECIFTGPNSLCVNGWCTAKRCADPSTAGGPCLIPEDCAQGLVCGADKTCGRPNGAACTSNSECLNTCLGQVCGDFLGFDAACTGDSEDCGPGLACQGNRCISADPGSCGCRTFQNQCVGAIDDACNPGFKPSQVSPCSCPTACACIPD